MASPHAGPAPTLNQAVELSRLAVTKDANSEYADALELYKAALEVWMGVLKGLADERQRGQVRNKMEEYMDRAEKIKEYLKQHDGVASH
eukprot:GDKH01025520.1.p1 GENE.GDKH01025520.1~~GDKH01025520.1.p1  ORF type:complete len:89 (+),score=19.37 GDKH01025520.1:131-397(+)